MTAATLSSLFRITAEGALSKMLGTRSVLNVGLYFYYYFEIFVVGSCCVAHVVLNLKSSCLNLPNVGIDYKCVPAHLAWILEYLCIHEDGPESECEIDICLRHLVIHMVWR
jgi:hypothetical protein